MIVNHGGFDMHDAIFVLGAADPEMNAIERLLTGAHVPHVRARVDGKRVYPANAYQATLPGTARAVLARRGIAYLVECVDHAPPHASRIDHHRAGDPGYGQPPARYWQASSIGQTVHALTQDLGIAVAVTPEMRLIAAGDHCLGAAYRGACPGIDPDALLRWHVASRAAFERRPGNAVLADIEASRAALRAAPRVELAAGTAVADMRARAYPELPIAAAREGQCCLSAITARDGRTKIGCLAGTPTEVSAFMLAWAPAHHLVDIYGDTARGFAGGYAPM